MTVSRARLNRYSSCRSGRRKAITIATRSGCWYLDIVDATVPPPSRCSTTVLVGQGMNMHPMKPARKPNEPRKMFFGSPCGPPLVINEINHPLSAPIAIPEMA